MITRRTTLRSTTFLAALSLAFGGFIPTASAVGGTASVDTSLRTEISEALSHPHVEDEVIVKFVPGSRAADQARTRRATGAVASEALSALADHSQVLRLGNGTTVGQALEALRRNPNVEYAEPNYLVESTAVSNDPRLTDGTLWGMLGDASTPSNQYGSQAAEAWAAGYIGSEDVYVAVIDTGVQVTHPDLAANMWSNPFEIAGNGIDDDGNGFADDIHGWDFADDDASVYDGLDDAHGTHVAGTIGGVGGNGTGVAGVNWDVTMITAKFLGASGGSTSDAVRAVDYVTDLKLRHGLNIVATSNSWGGGGATQSLLDAIERGGDAGILFVAAAGNGGRDQIGDDNDGSPHYPSNYVCDRTASGSVRGWDCVISVASITSNGSRSSFSNYGDVSVDLGAPGSSIYSTLPLNTYGSYSGTSMATPHVSGAIALCASINRAQTAAELRSAVFTNVAPTTSMNGLTTTNGRLDVSSMLTTCIGATEPVSGAPSGLTATAVDSSTIDLSWIDGSNAETLHEIEVSTDSCSTFILAAVAGADAESATVTGLDGATDHCFRVRSGNGFQGGTTSAWSNTATARTLDPPPEYVCVSEPYSWVSTTTGSALGLGDDAASTQSIGFSFPLYDRSHTSASVGSNGLLGLGDTANPYTNGTIPDAGQPNGVIAAFWDDLNPSAGGSVRVLRTGSTGARRFIASWEGVPHYNAANGVSFQVVLEEATGDVVLQYQDVMLNSAAYDRGASATVGIEHHSGERGTLLSFNRATLSDGTAYRCSLPTEVRITTASLPVGTTGSAYSLDLTAVGGNGDHTWSATGLPAGLSLSGSTISGTPTSAGTSSVDITVVSGDGTSDSASLQLVIGTPVTVTSTSLSGGAVGTAYSAALTATGGTGSYTWAVVSGSLPPGLALSGSTISGTPTTAGTATFTVRASDGAGRTDDQVLSITTTQALTVTTASLGAGTTGVAYSANLTATGGATPYSWDVTSGALPTGLSLTGTTISGTPTTPGTFDFTVRVTDATSDTATSSVSITVATPVTITTTVLDDGTTGTPYSASLTATGGAGSYVWSVVSGSLPTGLVLSGISGSTISGTPTATGTSSFTVRATDSGGRTATHVLSITITASLTSVATGEIVGGGTVSGTLEATHTLDGSGQSITEVSSGGRPRDRYDWMDHTWIVPVAPGSNTLTIVASWNDGGDNDSGARFEWFDGSSWNTVGTIGSSTPTTISALLGVPAVTEVQIRVSDTDRTARNSSTDRVTVDLISLTGDGETPPPSIVTTEVPDASFLVEYSVSIDVIGGTSPMVWEITSGSIPSGLTLDETTGVISGTPTSLGDWTFTVRVTDAENRSVTSGALSISVVDTPVAASMSATISLSTTGGRNKSGVATVTVLDDLGNAVVGAEVTLQFTGQFNDLLTGVTGANGSVTFTTADALRRPSFSACVIAVASTGLTWDGSEACSL